MRALSRRWVDAGRPSTVRRSTIYLTIVVVIVIAGGWGNDYRSCQRSAFWASYFNRASQAYVQAAGRADARATLDSHNPQALKLDRAAAASDRGYARKLRVQPLDCLRFPLPDVPEHGNL